MMRDYWNDPPEAPEPPECCDEIMEVDDKWNCFCTICRRIIPAHDYVDAEMPMPDEPIEAHDIPIPDHCHHGKAWGECDACDHASDIAYDAERERKFSR